MDKLQAVKAAAVALVALWDAGDEADHEAMLNALADELVDSGMVAHDYDVRRVAEAISVIAECLADGGAD